MDGTTGLGVMLPCAHEIRLKIPLYENQPGLNYTPAQVCDVAMLTPEVSNSLHHQFDSKLHLASSVFPVLSTTLRTNQSSLIPFLPVGVGADGSM